MEKVIIELISGLVLIGILPVLIIRQLQKGAVFLTVNKIDKKDILSAQFNYNKKIIYAVTITSNLILSAINQNNDMLMGTLLGSVFFQLLEFVL